MPNSRVLCTDTCPSGRRKDEILALTSRCAGLQKYESLDTRATYLDQCCFRSSGARFVDHARPQLRKPGDEASSGNTIVQTLTSQITHLKKQHRDENAALRAALEQAHGENLELRRHLARLGQNPQSSTTA